MEQLLAGTYLHQFAPAPETVRNALVTVESALLPEDLPDFEPHCRRELELLRAAASEGRLLLRTRRNRMTGAIGLVVCEEWAVEGHTLERVIAELLGAPDGDWDTQIEYFKHLLWLAVHNELSVVSHGADGRRIGFVARATRGNGRINVTYVARLLLTGLELAQWTNEVGR